MTVEWHTTQQSLKKDLAQQKEPHYTDVSSGETESPVFNQYKFNMGESPPTADGIQFKAYALVREKDVELLGMAALMFE